MTRPGVATREGVTAREVALATYRLPCSQGRRGASEGEGMAVRATGGGRYVSTHAHRSVCFTVALARPSPVSVVRGCVCLSR